MSDQDVTRLRVHLVTVLSWWDLHSPECFSVCCQVTPLSLRLQSGSLQRSVVTTEIMDEAAAAVLHETSGLLMCYCWDMGKLNSAICWLLKTNENSRKSNKVIMYKNYHFGHFAIIHCKMTKFNSVFRKVQCQSESVQVEKKRQIQTDLKTDAVSN